MAKKKVLIIGAGPAGCYLAALLAKKYEVLVFEDHKKIGIPIQCTGIVTSEISKLIEIKQDFLINKINNAEIFSENNSVNLKLKNENLIINRTKFDGYLAEKARQRGAKISLGARFLGYTNKKAAIKIKNSVKEVSFDILVGADGPNSTVNKIFFKNKYKLLIGAQARARINNDNSVKFYLTEGKIAWLVPENKNIARIGIIIEKNTNKIFNAFLEKILGNSFKSKIIEYQGGLVPVYSSEAKTHTKINGKEIFLLGDAASQVKATTYGGIIQGLTAAKAIASYLNEGKTYSEEIKKLNKELKLHFKIRKILDTFSKKDYDALISIINKRKNKKILEIHERDDISKIAFKLIFSEPKLLYFAKNLIKSLF